MNLTKTTRIEEYPAIGIRPIVDGRRGGIRESLEDITMTISQSVADFLTQTLSYPNGEPVRCVLADTCIGGVVEANAAERKFVKHNVGVSISVTPSWCYPTETMEQNPYRPTAVWGINSTERPGAVYLAAVTAAHNQKGFPVFKIYGREVQDITDTSIPVDVQLKLQQFARAGLAVAMMRGKSYLSIGTVSMGIAGCIVDETFYQDYLGMKNEYVDMTEFIRRIEQGIFDEDEFAQALTWARTHLKEGLDPNPVGQQRTAEQKLRDWETSIKMTLIARDLMVGNPKLEVLGFGEEALGHDALAAGFQGQRQWTDHLPNGDVMEALLNSSFDWNGTRAPYILATENDGLNAISMLFGYLVTNRAQVFADVRTYWSGNSIKRVTGEDIALSADGVLHLTNSGPASLDGVGGQYSNGLPSIKPYWDITDTDVRHCLDATTWYPAVDFFRGGGFSSQYISEGGMPLTMVRINIVKGLGPVLQLAEGYSYPMNKNVHEILSNRTNPTWPSTWFVPNLTGNGAFTDVYSVMQNWGSNHCSISYGHIGADLITLASMLRIPVSMHNVEITRIFRPATWTQFGIDGDLTGADFRACLNLGPIYG